jgi:hypothetical protein
MKNSEKLPFPESIKEYVKFWEKYVAAVEEPKQETSEEAAKNYIGLSLDKDMDVEERYYNPNVKAYDAFIEGVNWAQHQDRTSKVTRVEVIQHSPPHNGRAYVNRKAKDVEIQYQDKGKTVKVFLK